MAADPVVKGIILILAFASVVTWSVFIAKTIEMGLAKRRLRHDVEALRSHLFLNDAHRAQSQGRGLVATLLNDTVAELRAMATMGTRAGIESRIASRMDETEQAAGRAMRAGTGILATIGSTSPFVGLLGTVWGIMNSFIGIAASHTTNLAVVAPGIAEALLATAIGLLAAIPAVIVYNAFARSIASYRALVRQACAEITRMASRELDRAGSASLGSVRLAAE